jgi:hypothetical protein
MLASYEGKKEEKGRKEEKYALIELIILTTTMEAYLMILWGITY